jgi:large subunit ribosomal protein L25
MAEITLKSQIRKERGKGAAKHLRARGKVPGIVYGKGIEPVSIELEGQDVYALTHGSHAASLESVIVSLEIQDGGENEPRPTLITEIQHHPITADILHIDFHQISLTERIRARIPVVAVGESPGVSEGGILEHALRELDVSCKAMDLPEETKVDISKLGLGESIHVRDIDLGPNVEILNDPDLSVISVTVPRAAPEVAVVEAEEEVEEPEVIGEKKPEEEEEDQSPKGKREE